MSCALEEKYMGDRTEVYLSIPHELRGQAEIIIGDATDEYWQEGTLAVLGYMQVDYGELPNLEYLKEAGIPYDSCWQAGGNFGAGKEACRFTPEGECIMRTIYDADLNPNISHLNTLLNTPDILINYLKKFIENTTILPWDNQVEYGKRYKMRQLITT